MGLEFESVVWLVNFNHNLQSCVTYAYLATKVSSHEQEYIHKPHLKGTLNYRNNFSLRPCKFMYIFMSPWTR